MRRRFIAGYKQADQIEETYTTNVLMLILIQCRHIHLQSIFFALSTSLDMLHDSDVMQPLDQAHYTMTTVLAMDEPCRLLFRSWSERSCFRPCLHQVDQHRSSPAIGHYIAQAIASETLTAKLPALDSHLTTHFSSPK